MKIGIITFHWATNYGAILQSYCLQEFLRSQGHEVEIINYKPKQYDFSWFRMLRHPSLWQSIPKILIERKKEKLLVPFRYKNLNITKRFYYGKEIEDCVSNYDVIISGSDQILNPGFTLYGEDMKPTSAYYLGFAPQKCKKIGYAVSFGCIDYPGKASVYASQWIQNFDCIGVRESTGLNILEQLSYTKTATIVPDPTVLYGKQLFKNLGINIPAQKKNYTCVYMLRHEISIKGNVKYIDEKNDPVTLEKWLHMISSAEGLITNSYHGMIMAILAHVPFVAFLETGSGSGMNDRFFTLLSQLGLEDRIVSSVEEANLRMKQVIDFQSVDMKIIEYSKKGVYFLGECVH